MLHSSVEIKKAQHLVITYDVIGKGICDTKTTAHSLTQEAAQDNLGLCSAKFGLYLLGSEVIFFFLSYIRGELVQELNV